MFPNWVAGKVALDIAERARRMPARLPSDKKSSGLLSFLAVLLIVGATFMQSLERFQTSVLFACASALLVGIAVYWIAFHMHGWLGVSVGVAFAGLAAYALHVVIMGSSDASLVWDIVVFLAVGADQLALKLSARKKSGY